MTPPTVKNEHIVYAYAPHDEGGYVLIVGLTDAGLAYLKAGEGEDKRTLVINPPGTSFMDVKLVVVFHERDKATLKQRLRETGKVVSEVN